MKRILIVIGISIGLMACNFNGGKTSTSITKSNGQTKYVATYPSNKQSDVEDYLKDEFESDIQTVDVPTTQTLKVEGKTLRFTIMLNDGETSISYLDKENSEEAIQKLDDICKGIASVLN